MNAAGMSPARSSLPCSSGDSSVLEYWIAGSLLVGLLQWFAVAGDIVLGPGEDSLTAAAAFAALGSLVLALALPVARMQAERLASGKRVELSTLALDVGVGVLVVLLWRATVLSVSLLVEIGSVPLAQIQMWWEHAGPWQLQSDLVLYGALLAGLVVAKRRQPFGEERASESRALESTRDPAHDLRRLPVRSGDRVRLIPVDEILWLEGAGSYVRIHLDGESHLARNTLTDLARRLEPAGFLRVHRSSILNLRYLKSLESAGRGALRARLTDGTTVRVAASRTDSLESAIGKSVGR